MTIQKTATQRRSERLAGALHKVATLMKQAAPSWYKGSRPWSEVPDATKAAMIKRHQARNSGSEKQMQGATSKSDLPTAKRTAVKHKQEGAQLRADANKGTSKKMQDAPAPGDIKTKKRVAAEHKQEGAQLRADAKKGTYTPMQPKATRKDVQRAKILRDKPGLRP